MPFTKFTNLDFDQIKTSIKDYLRANSDFTDFDFEGSNFSALIDTLAYNTYITAFNSNMIVNESFLDSATVRQNVVSLAGNIGYVPRSKTASKTTVSVRTVLTSDLDDNTIETVTLSGGIFSTGTSNDTSFVFSTIEDIKGKIEEETGVGKVAYFDNIPIYQGTLLKKKFLYDGSLDQKFILNNSNIDTTTISVYISDSGTEKGFKYVPVENILNVNKDSRIYFIREIQDEKYEIRFGDGIFGKKLGDEPGSDGSYITVEYLITDGEEGNGVKNFTYAGSIKNQNGAIVSPNETLIRGEKVNGVYNDQPLKSQNGNNIEPIDSVRYFAPLAYSAQNRAVTPRDYEAIIKRIYPDAESMSIVGGEELDPPEFGNVLISIKPKGGTFVSDFNKKQILSKLRQYSVSGINQRIIDLKILYVELDSSVYYNESFISTVSSLQSEVLNQLTEYSKSTNFNKFGGRFKYSKLQNIIDEVDRNAITSNITKVKIRRDLKVAINQLVQYELCYGNRFHVKDAFNIKSTGFRIFDEPSTVYFTDIPNDDQKTGILQIVKITGENTTKIVKSSAGRIDYIKGEIIIDTVNIVSTDKPDNIIEIEAVPESNDVIGLKDLYLSLDVSKSRINMLRDLISSGDEISGVKFIEDSFTSSYSNGSIIRN
jgi:hypothetical protein|tara:strand:- start:13734 stop:15695 length:1962 start_codon:yes stop_codon:yes gene_type:complete